MYKVFSNDRVFFLTDNESIVSTENSGLFYKYSDNNDFYNFWEVFEKISDLKKIFIVNSNLKNLIENFESHFKIINAAGGIVHNNKGEIILIERLGKWDLPKGKVEHNENIETTAIREVEEECGIKGLVISNKIQITRHTYIKDNQEILKKTHWFKMLYNGNPELTPQKQENITKALWVTKNKINSMLNNNNTYLSIIDILTTLGYFSYR